MRALTKIGVALGSAFLACLLCVGGFGLFFAPFRFGLIQLPKDDSVALVRWFFNLLPVVAIVVTLMAAFFLSRRFYREFTKRFLSGRI
jgi:hypothetical protein